MGKTLHADFSKVYWDVYENLPRTLSKLAKCFSESSESIQKKNLLNDLVSIPTRKVNYSRDIQLSNER